MRCLRVLQLDSGYSTCVRFGGFWYFSLFLCVGGLGSRGQVSHSGGVWRTFVWSGHFSTSPCFLQTPVRCWVLRCSLLLTAVAWSMAGFAGVLAALRSLLMLSGPRMLCIMAGMDQKDIHAATLWPRSSPTMSVACFGVVLLVGCTSLCVLRLSAGPPYVCIMVGMDQCAISFWHVNGIRGPDSENCLEVCSCCSSKVVDNPVFMRRLIPVVLLVQKTIEIPQFVDTVADVPVVWPCRFSVAAMEKTAAIPQLQLLIFVLGRGRSACRKTSWKSCRCSACSIGCRRCISDGFGLACRALGTSRVDPRHQGGEGVAGSPGV